jgi:hypothetical protein
LGAKSIANYGGLAVPVSPHRDGVEHIRHEKYSVWPMGTFLGYLQREHYLDSRSVHFDGLDHKPCQPNQHTGK